MLVSHADNRKPCVLAKKYLVSKGINFAYAAPVPGHEIAMTVGGKTVTGFNAPAYAKALADAGYPQGGPGALDQCASCSSSLP